ncbi:MAG: glycoside hydrolase family 127 protein [Cytophagaceae bacterium]|nr:glycoside hydrolase family 127 protein [Cytophagaceae bacterium]
MRNRLSVVCSLLWIVPLLSPAQDYPIRPVPFTAVKVTSQFWAPRLETNRTVTIPFAFKKCEETGRIDNFAVAGGLKKGTFRGIRYDDSDVFKIIEGAAYSLASHPDKQLDAYLDDLIHKIAAAQESDGYLYTVRTIQGDSIKDVNGAGKTRFSRLEGSHELYNVGHLYEAAVAHFQATKKKTLLDVAVKNADFLVKTFGPDKLVAVEGHEEVEIGLVKLYRVTGKKAYLDLAKFFLDMRGRADKRQLYVVGHNQAGHVPTRHDSVYFQDHRPVAQQTEVVGHAVRAGYLYAGMADVDAVMGSKTYRPALDALWNNATNQKLYLTGGVGAHRSGENFGDNYELPNQEAYAETCAAVAQMLWNYRMFLLTGEARYLDVFERSLYNGFLAGVSESGDQFFYPNPLAADGKEKFNMGLATRSPWFGTACCPSNVARVLPSLPGYVYAVRPGAGQTQRAFVNLFMAGTGTLPLEKGNVRLTQETNYPWSGVVKISVEPEKAGAFSLAIRLPGWAQGRPVPGDLYRYTDTRKEQIVLKVNGKTATYVLEKGFAVLDRSWKGGDIVELELPMPVRKVLANDKVQADRGKVALERGPIVYCVEGVDNGGTVSNLSISDQTQFSTVSAPDFITAATLIKAKENGRTFTAIPYHLWSHRGPGEMAVWLPKK